MVSTADAWHRAVKKIMKVTLLYGTYRELMEAFGYHRFWFTKPQGTRPAYVSTLCV